MRRPLATVALAAAIGGCVLIIRPDPPDPPPGGFGMCQPMPGAPTIQVIAAVRLDPALPPLAEAIDRFVLQPAATLAQSGFDVSVAAIVSLSESSAEPYGFGAWGCGLPWPGLPSELFRAEAGRATRGAPTTCALAGLLEAGKSLPDFRISPPAAAAGYNLFGPAPDHVLFIHVDPLARTRGLADPSCAGVELLHQTRDDGLAAWPRYLNGRTLPMERVTHWFLRADEGTTDAATLEACRKIEGFPLNLLDVIEGSRTRLYDPLAEAIDDAGGHARTLSICQALVGDADEAFFVPELVRLVESAGLPASSEKILERFRTPAADLIGGGGGPGEGGPMTLPGTWDAGSRGF